MDSITVSIPIGPLVSTQCQAFVDCDFQAIIILAFLPLYLFLMKRNPQFSHVLNFAISFYLQLSAPVFLYRVLTLRVGYIGFC